MDESLSIKEELRLTVSPQYYRKMHRKVARITGLDNETVKKGISFPEAFRLLAKFCGEDFVFLTWGPDDIPMLRDNLILFSMDEEAYLQKCTAAQMFIRENKNAVMQAKKVLDFVKCFFL
jgi:hypothetical protein